MKSDCEVNPYDPKEVQKAYQQITTLQQQVERLRVALDEITSYAASVCLDRPYVNPDFIDTMFQLQTDDWCQGLMEHVNLANATLAATAPTQEKE